MPDAREQRAYDTAHGVTCPVCEAPPGTPCDWPGAMGVFHRERLVAATTRPVVSIDAWVEGEDDELWAEDGNWPGGPSDY